MFDVFTFLSTADLSILMPLALGAFFVLALAYKAITLVGTILARDNAARMGNYSAPRKYHTRNGHQ